MNGLSKWARKEILITVKAYPNASKKYGETVCVAGINLTDQEWIRLYPVPFRFLDRPDQFHKYDIISINVTKQTSDPRPESYRPNLQTLEIRQHVSTGKKKDWMARKNYVMPFLDESMCNIINEQKESRKSLGLFKPKKVKSFTMELDEDERSKADQRIAGQLSFLTRGSGPLEIIPYKFKYHYYCTSPSCNGHRMQVIDWEASALFRNLRDEYGDDVERIEAKMRQKWLDDFFSQNKDSYFFVGNMRKFPQSFITLGVFRPPKIFTLFDQ